MLIYGGTTTQGVAIKSIGEYMAVEEKYHIVIANLYYDGKVSLCCNDPLGKNTLGDLTQNSILEIWYNDRFKMVRKCLSKGRKNWKHCEFCDAFTIV